MDSADELDTFLVLAETGHMGRAAARMGLTQPGLSARLRKLEAKLGLQLFDRHASGMTLSAAGRELLEQARHARAHLGRLQERMLAVSQGDVPVIRVGMTLLSGVSRVPMLLRRVEERASGTRFVLHEALSSPLEQLVADAELDLAFVHPPIAHEALTTKTLYSEPMVLSVPSAWTVPRSNDARRRWLREQRLYWVGPRIGPELHRRVSAWTKRLRVTLTPNAEVSSYVIAQSFVAAGAGIALVPKSVSRLHPDTVRTVPLDERMPELGFSVVRRRRAVGAVYDLVCEVARDMRDAS